MYFMHKRLYTQEHAAYRLRHVTGALTVSNILSLSRMMQFGDSMLPIGTFAFSAGVESAVQKGVVRDVETLRQYTLTALEQAARGDAVAVVWSARAALAAMADGDLAALVHIDNEVLCRKLTDEPRSMCLRTGKKLAEMAADVTCSGLMSRWLAAIRQGETPGTFPVTQAMLFVSMSLEDEGVQSPRLFDTQQAVDTPYVTHAFVAHQYGVAMTILNAAMRLMRITHIDTQRILYSLTPHFESMCAIALATPLEQMSSFAPMADILAAVHVKGRVRLFMS